MNQPDLLTRLGGVDALKSIVDDMYQSVYEDPELAAFFQRVPRERLAQMQFQFLASAFGGPVLYSGSELAEIHRPHHISGKDFARFCNHFANALEQRDVDPKDIDLALAQLATYQGKITGESNVDG